MRKILYLCIALMFGAAALLTNVQATLYGVNCGLWIGMALDAWIDLRGRHDRMRALLGRRAAERVELIDVLRRCESWLSTHPEGRVMQIVCRQAIINVTKD